MGFFSCICSVLFPTNLQPLADVFNAVISFFILAAILWASVVFLSYLLFGVTLPWYPKFEDVRVTFSFSLTIQHHMADTDAAQNQNNHHHQQKNHNNHHNHHNHQNQKNHQHHQDNQNSHYNQHRNRVHFGDEVNDVPANEKHITDLRNTRHGEQLFIDGYLQGYRDGKRGKKPVYTQSDSWKEAGEEALEHIRQSFVHDEEKLRRAMLG